MWILSEKHKERRLGKRVSEKSLQKEPTKEIAFVLKKN
jgi:hypothetical protein